MLFRMTAAFALLGLPANPVLAQTQSLLGGRYTTTADVSGILQLAQDTVDMKETSDTEEKATIYSQGRHATNGGANDERLSLADLSLEAGKEMSKTPYYNIYRHGFLVLGDVDEGEPNGNFDGQPASNYADTIVNDLFDLDIPNIETDAALVMNVWMAAVHELFLTARECKANNPDRALENLDRSIALWIGDGEVQGQNDRGHMLYNLAQKVGTRFGQDGPDGETKVNTDLINKFLILQADISQNNKCAEPAYYLTIRKMVKDMISIMTVPLAQNLIHHLWNIENEGNSDLIELYALSLLPPVATCDPDVYRSELRHTVLKTTAVADRDDAISELQRAFSCLGITCEDVGAYKGSEVPQCTDPVGLNLVGYSSDSRDTARIRSYVDRDISQIGVFIKFEDIGSAIDWYEFGWNSRTTTLLDLAQNALFSSSENSLFTTFQSYYNDPMFAHDFIMSVLQRTGPNYVLASTQQVRLLVTSYLQYVVLFFSATASLEAAATNCGRDQPLALEHLDSAVAYYAGSIEGPEQQGSSEDAGTLLFSVAKDYCAEFDTCNPSVSQIPIAKANVQIIEGFKLSATNIKASNCDAFEKSIEDVFGRYIPVPLYQGLLRYASINANLPPGTSENESLSVGFAFSQALLPIINYASEDSAVIIGRNMNFDTTNPVQDGFDAVADALRSAMAGLETKCGDIGVYKDAPSSGDLCASRVMPTVAPVSPPVMIQPTFAPNPDPTFAPIGDVHPTPATIDQLAFGRYTFKSLNFATADAAFADDIKAMFQAEDASAAQEIYTNGGNTSSEPLSGEIGVTTLSQLSTMAVEYMSKDPMFNIFKYALYDDVDLPDQDETDFIYADDMVQEALSVPEDPKLAAEAAVILNVWMVITNRLYGAIRLCNNDADASTLIDSAVALWIGNEQAEGKYDHGWMMYSIAQSAAKYFGLPEAEAKVNTKLMDLFNDAQGIAATCQSSDTAVQELRIKSDEIIRLLTIPLVQSLMFHMVENNRNMVDMYAVAVLPQCVACDPTAHDNLIDVTYDDYDRADSFTDEIKDSLASFLRCLRITCDDLEVTDSAGQGLKNFVDDICVRLDDSKPTPIAGYAPTNNVVEESRMDLDVMQVQIFMTTKAYDAAYDVYTYGRNSLMEDGKSLRTLKQLATSSDRSSVALFDGFKTYYGNDRNFAHDQIKAAMAQTGIYENAGRKQLQQIVERTLQTSVMYLAVFWNLQHALDACNNDDMETASKAWDRSVAYYVGSIEGPMAGGQEDGDGEMLFALANEMCDEFDYCAGNGGSKLNEDMLKHFRDGQDAIAQKHCETLERTMTWEVLPTATVPLIQGTLYYAIINDQANITGEEASVAAGSAIAYAVGPLVNAANSTSGETIKRNFDFSQPAMQDGAAKVFEAITYSLRGIGLDCNDIGKPKNGDGLDPCTVMIDDNQDGVTDATVKPVAPHQDTETNLGEGLYVATTYVEDRADIALDIKGMQGGLNQKETELAKVIYESGQNSNIYDENGQFVALRSFQKMSTEETANMSFMPLFNVFMYALQDSDGNFDGKDARLYADTLVQETFTVATQPGEVTYLPAEAATVLNLWMFIVYTLEKTLSLCEQKKIRGDDGISAMDEAVAYWIGDGQIAGDGERGHLLYALTENMAEIFDTEVAGQARANTNLLKLFNSAKNELSLSNACSNSPATYIQLRARVYDIIGQMSVPLIQGLIDSLRTNDRPRVKVYAHAFVPMVSQCDPVIFGYLKDKLLDMTYNVVDVDTIVEKVQTVYPCLGLTCSDIGAHSSARNDLAAGNKAECRDPSVRTKMAGYAPTTDVREFASLDLDILQLDILLQMKAYDAAKEVYMFGKNVREEGANGGSLSLSHLATTSERSIVPEFDAFNRYFNSGDYADKIILDAFDGSDMSDDARRLVILRSSQVLVMYFAVAQAILEAVDECETVKAAVSANAVGTPGVNAAWDRAAALMIGSLEGSENNGSGNGFMFYNIAQEHCVEFGTCKSPDDNSRVNEEMVTLLFAGRGAVISNSCDALRKTAGELKALTLIPMIQATLSSALRLGRDFSAANRAEGDILAKSLVPLVQNSNRDSAKVLSDTMLNPSYDSRKKARIAPDVFSALANVYGDLDVDCNLIGDAGGYDACSGAGVSSDGKNPGVIAGIVLGVAAAVLIIVACACRFCKRKKTEQKRLPENNPTFVTANGELNHSMDLLTKAFSSNSHSRNPVDTEEMKGLNDASPTVDDDFEESPALLSKGRGTDII